ncbi:MAG TPA: M15 family metallopeptidase [Candidatus Saccharimonadales bacterium]|nr:M15 family metallopeptidase [Candidatus Saccharimonadales bacterium]
MSNATRKSSSNFNKKKHSLNEPASVWVVINKQLALNPAGYEPAGLVTPAMPLRLAAGSMEMLVRSDAVSALEQLTKEAETQGVRLMLASGYRSHGFQKNLYNNYVKTQGQTVADRTSARPGHSEHQTGLAIDLEPVSRKCEVEVCFGDLTEGKWLAAHAHAYGFIIRYPKGKEAITGYDYEPWHLRYVGTELAAEMHKQNIQTLEEFFNLGAAATYKP